MMKLAITISIIAFGLGLSAAQAFPVTSVQKDTARLGAAPESSVLLVGQNSYKPAKAYKNKKRRAHRGATNLKTNRRRVGDTCPGGDHKCIKDLKANCDKAKGGLSTEPDGGVDCFVVGIHDQPDQSD